MNMEDEGSLARQARASLTRSEELHRNASDLKVLIEKGSVFIYLLYCCMTLGCIYHTLLAVIVINC
jgi:hypothetical protein